MSFSRRNRKRSGSRQACCRVGDNGWTPDIFQPILTFSNQNISVLTLCLAKTGTCCKQWWEQFSARGQNCVQDGADNLSPCEELSVSYALKETTLVLEENRMSSAIDLCPRERVFILAVQTVLYCVMVNAHSFGVRRSIY